MALSNEEKLKNFADEAMNDAKKISEEIETKAKKEFQEKLDDGDKKLLSQIYGYIQTEIEKTKKEKSLKISRANIQARQDYFKYGDSAAQKIFEIVSEKLKGYMESDGYAEYLFECCRNVLEKAGTDMDILYMPKDEEIITGKVKNRLAGLFDTAQIGFVKDETIKVGGLRFFERGKNILINEGFDEKTERAKELLNSLIGPHFMSINKEVEQN